MILITGAAGFIGSNFVHFILEKNKDIRVIGYDALTYAGNLNNLTSLNKDQKERFKFIQGDINDYHLLDTLFEKYNINCLVNFAAESHVDRSIKHPQIFLKTNILGTQTLLEVSKKHWFKNGKWNEESKFVQISTDEVYGSLGSEGYFTEKSNLSPNSPYSASKASADLIVNAYYSTYQAPVNITRCSNNYGPYQFPEKLIPLMINNAINHKKLPIYGDGKNIRDWIYVKDHCKAISLVIEKGKKGEIYNVGGYNERENIQLVKEIIRIVQNKTNDVNISEKLINHVEDRLGHDFRYAIEPKKIEENLGWKLEVQFEEGLELTIDWYLKNSDWLESIIQKRYLKENTVLSKLFQ